MLKRIRQWLVDLIADGVRKGTADGFNAIINDARHGREEEARRADRGNRQRVA